MNTIGVVAAVSSFLAIWFGHVAVRKIEFSAPRLRTPAALFILLGILLEGLAASTAALPAAAAFGIVGFTFLWDALELKRQEGRVRKGHAPANPRNPRHAEILTAPGSQATTLNRLKREPAALPGRIGRGIIY